MATNKTQLEPGTIIKIQNLKTAVEKNGTLGVIKKFMPNGSYRVMVHGKSDLGMKMENLEVLNQCSGKYRHKYEAALIWPRINKSDIPSIYAIQDLYPEIGEHFVKPVDCQDPGPGYAFQSLQVTPESNPANIHKKGTKMAKFSDVLKKTLGWKKPDYFMAIHETSHTSECKHYPDNYFIGNAYAVWFDEASEADVNDWIQIRFNQEGVPPIRGACLYWDRLYKREVSEKEPSIFDFTRNSMYQRWMTRGWNVNRFKTYFYCNRINARKNEKDMQDYRSLARPMIEKMNKDNHCDGLCAACDFAVANPVC